MRAKGRLLQPVVWAAAVAVLLAAVSSASAFPEPGPGYTPPGHAPITLWTGNVGGANSLGYPGTECLPFNGMIGFDSSAGWQIANPVPPDKTHIVGQLLITSFTVTSWPDQIVKYEAPGGVVRFNGVVSDDGYVEEDLDVDLVPVDGGPVVRMHWPMIATVSSFGQGAPTCA